MILLSREAAYVVLYLRRWGIRNAYSNSFYLIMTYYKKHISKNIIENYLYNFYGYGEWNSNIWFLGMEEAGQYAEEKITKFFKKKYARKDLIDNCKFQYEFTPRFFDYKIQDTWRPIIMILLYLAGEKDIFVTKEQDPKSFTANKKNICAFQFNHWGRNGSYRCDGIRSNALIEFLPLPISNMKDSIFNTVYNYNDFDQVFKDKNDYKNYCWHQRGKAERLSFIKGQINKYKPELVLAYAKKFGKEFDKILNKPGHFKEILIENYKGTKNKAEFYYQVETCTLFVLCNQPNSRNQTRQYWVNLAEAIEETLVAADIYESSKIVKDYLII